MNETFYENITMTVLKVTAADLRMISKEAGLTVGQMVDRITAQFSPKDPELASRFILEDLLTIPAKLDEHERQSVYRDICKQLLELLDPDSIDELVEQAKDEMLEGK